VAEVALSALLLVAGGLLVRTLIEMRQAPLGFDADNLYSVGLTLPQDRYPDATARRSALDALTHRLQAIPGAQGVAIALGGPADVGVTFGSFEVEGQPAPEGGRDVIGYNAISPNYFGLTGTPFVEGRPFDGEDLDSAVVSASLARRIAPNGPALDRRFRLDPKAPWRRVIGVVGDVKVPRPGGVEGLGGQVMYVPFEPTYPEAWILLRTTGQPAGLQAILRTELEAVDPGIKLLDVRAAGTAAVEAQALPRFIAGILTTFAVLAVLMSSIGLYGVIAYTVTRRWREIGIRISLGPPARAAPPPWKSWNPAQNAHRAA
jgi:putative ABC transport system permease protein